MWGNWFSSLPWFPLDIWLQSFKHCFMENHGENKASSTYYHLPSINYHVYFLQDIRFIFFSVWVSCQQGKGKAIILAPLFHFHLLPKLFGLQYFHFSERFDDEQELRKWIHEPYYIFFIIKTSIRVNKGAGFLDLLLNISFQPLIIVVKHSVIKLDVTELLDLPQVFTY